MPEPGVGLGRREEGGNGALSFLASDAFCVHFFLRMGWRGFLHLSQCQFTFTREVSGK